MACRVAVGGERVVPVAGLLHDAYRGLIRQTQRCFDVDYHVQLSFENINTPELGPYGVDHLKVAEGLGCKALRMRNPDDILPHLKKRKSSPCDTVSRSSSR